MCKSNIECKERLLRFNLSSFFFQTNLLPLSHNSLSHSLFLSKISLQNISTHPPFYTSLYTLSPYLFLFSFVFMCFRQQSPSPLHHRLGQPCPKPPLSPLSVSRYSIKANTKQQDRTPTSPSFSFRVQQEPGPTGPGFSPFPPFFHGFP